MRRSRTIAIQCSHRCPSLLAGQCNTPKPGRLPGFSRFSEDDRTVIYLGLPRMGPLQPFSTLSPSAQFESLSYASYPTSRLRFQCTKPICQVRWNTPPRATLSSSGCMPRRLHCSLGSRSEQPDATKDGRMAVMVCCPPSQLGGLETVAALDQRVAGWIRRR